MSSNERSSKKNKEAKEELKINKSSGVRKMTFDLYFQLLMNTNKRIQPHHKAAIKSYTSRLIGTDTASKEDFDLALKDY